MEQKQSKNKMLISMLVYLVIIGVGIHIRFSNLTPIIFDPDSAGYLTPALNFLIYGEFNHSHARSYPYSAFLAIVLFFAQDLNAIVFTQHLLAVASIVTFILILEKQVLMGFLDINRYLLRFSTYLIIALIAWDGEILQYEYMLRPEGLLLASHLLIISSIIQAKRKVMHKSGITYFSLSVLLLVFSSLLHQRFLLSFLFITLIMTIYFVIKQKTLQKQLIVIGITLLVIVACYLPEFFLVHKYEKTTKAFSLVQFFYSNLPIVNNLLISGVYVEPYFDQKILKEEIKGALENTNLDHYYHRILKYNMDELQYRTIGPKIDAHFYGSDNFEARYNNYYLNWSKNIVLNRPFEVLKKVNRQLSAVFFTNLTYYRGFVIRSDYNQVFERGTEYYDYLVRSLGYEPEMIKVIRSNSTIDAIISKTYVGIHYIYLLSLIVVFFLTALKKSSLITIVTFFSIILYLLTVATFHTFDIGRYVHGIRALIYLLILFCVVDLINVYRQKSQRIVTH